jgi:hypothetical protein
MVIFLKKKLLVCGAVCCLIIGTLLFFYIRTHAPDSQSSIHLSYSICMQNPTNQVIRNTALQASVPLENTSFQQRINLSANYPHELSRIESGQEVLNFKWAIFPPFTTKIVTIHSDIKIYKDPRSSGEKDLNPYLKPQPLIESDHEIIRALAGQLKADSVQETIQKTFDWVSQRIDYTGYIKRARGALYAARYKKGDCTEFAYLFVALCRANGIPARVVRGFVCLNSAVLDPGDYHEWAEFHHKGRWQVADPQRKRLREAQNTYIAFQVFQTETENNGSLVGDIKGNGLIVKLNK